jgi:hypothetical protein
MLKAMRQENLNMVHYLNMNELFGKPDRRFFANPFLHCLHNASVKARELLGLE